MFSNLIINDFKELFNFFQLLNLKLYFTKPQLKTLQAFIVSMMLHGFQGKMTDVSNLTLCLSHKHYHEPDNTKWDYELQSNSLINRKDNTPAPPNVQRVVETEWFKVAIKKAKKILGV